MTKETPLQKVSQNLEKLFDLYPLDLQERAKDIDLRMRDGLATMYSTQGFREYVENAVRVTNKQLIRSLTPEHMLYYKARMDALMQLLAVAQTCYIKFEMSRRRTEKERVDQVEKDAKLTEEVKL